MVHEHSSTRWPAPSCRWLAMCLRCIVASSRLMTMTQFTYYKTAPNYNCTHSSIQTKWINNSHTLIHIHTRTGRRKMLIEMGLSLAFNCLLIFPFRRPESLAHDSGSRLLLSVSLSLSLFSHVQSIETVEIQKMLPSTVRRIIIHTKWSPRISQF